MLSKISCAARLLSACLWVSTWSSEGDCAQTVTWPQPFLTGHAGRSHQTPCSTVLLPAVQAGISLLMAAILVIWTAVTFRQPLPTPLPDNLGVNYSGLSSIAVMPISLFSASIFRLAWGLDAARPPPRKKRLVHRHMQGTTSEDTTLSHPLAEPCPPSHVSHHLRRHSLVPLPCKALSTITCEPPPRKTQPCPSAPDALRIKGLLGKPGLNVSLPG